MSSMGFGRFSVSGKQALALAGREDDGRHARAPGWKERLLLVLHLVDADELVDALERDDLVVDAAGVALFPEGLQRLGHRLDRRADRVVCHDDELEAGLVERLHLRRAVDRGHAHERGARPVPELREGEDLVRVLRLRVDEDHVGAGVRVRAAAPERLLHAPARDEGLGARDHDEVAVPLRRLGGADLGRVLLDVGQLALHARVEAAPLGEDVVLDADRRDAGGLVLLDAPDDVDGVAVAVVAVGHDRQAARRAHHLRDGEVLRHREDVRVGDRVARGDLEAGRPEPVESGLFADPGRQAVVCADDDDRARPSHQFPEFSSFRHGTSNLSQRGGLLPRPAPRRPLRASCRPEIPRFPLE
jgi:hypothetical protein